MTTAEPTPPAPPPSPTPVVIAPDGPRPVTIGGGGLALLAGPCLIESEEHALAMAERLAEAAQAAGMPLVFKASFDKANRSSVHSPRGPGLEAGLPVLARVRERFGLPVITDIHEAHQAAPVAEVVDVLQIPAFLSRQTDLLIAAGATGKPVNIKKGQFQAPWDMAQSVAKVRSTGNDAVLLTERGACFGYNNLVVDMRSLPLMRGQGVPVVFDATHSVQLPGGEGIRSGGDRTMAPVLARAAVAVGVDAVFLEVHDDPDHAPCDGPNMIRLEDVPALLDTLMRLNEVARPLKHGPDTGAK